MMQFETNAAPFLLLSVIFLRFVDLTWQTHCQEWPVQIKFSLIGIADGVAQELTCRLLDIFLEKHVQSDLTDQKKKKKSSAESLYASSYK